MNRNMLETGQLKKINKSELLQLVARTNVILTDVITKLKLLERYPPAWKHAQYGQIWEYLREELEVEDRFENMGTKVRRLFGWWSLCFVIARLLL